MAETITMPKLGFDMAEGTLVRWVRNEGENINKGDVLAEIETDKATVEVELSASGIVRKLLVDQGAIVPIGAPIAIVGSADEKIEEPKVEVNKQKAEVVPQPPLKVAPIAQTVVAPQVGPVKASPLAKKMAAIPKLIYPMFKARVPEGGLFARI